MIASLLAGVATSSWARTAAELARLPDGPAITEMLSDYAVMRHQALLCR
jgi:hypothetical protein